jgi:argininosuccinate lyase
VVNRTEPTPPAPADDHAVTALTGRIADSPSALLRDEVLDPQFRQDSANQFRWLVCVEKALLAEYRRMEVIDEAGTLGIAAALTEVERTGVRADPDANMSDLALAIERGVLGHIDLPVWHVDRSRNDLQATAQLLAGRVRVLRAITQLLNCARAAHRLAGRHTEDVFPGYTHLQAAQVITPGFFVGALTEHLLHSVRRLLSTYDGLNRCPLGAGALAGQELAWDRDRLSRLLGFDGPVRHALVAVASRSWLLELAAECSVFAVGTSRWLTDLMTFCGSEHGLADLPDELAGISSAMPQKKNYPILERIRGRTAHLSAWYVDVAMGQRNTPLSNTVEVSKESAAQLDPAMDSLRSGLRLLTAVLENLEFRTGHARDRCADEYLGGFSLANTLTLQAHVPWRNAQVIAGRYIVAAIAMGLRAGTPDGALLRRIADGQGYRIPDPEPILRAAFDPVAELDRRRTPGSAHPASVRALLAHQQEELARLDDECAARRDTLDGVPAAVDAALVVLRA